MAELFDLYKTSNNTCRQRDMVLQNFVNQKPQLQICYGQTFKMMR